MKTFVPSHIKRNLAGLLVWSLSLSLLPLYEGAVSAETARASTDDGAPVKVTQTAELNLDTNPSSPLPGSGFSQAEETTIRTTPTTPPQTDSTTPVMLEDRCVATPTTTMPPPTTLDTTPNTSPPATVPPTSSPTTTVDLGSHLAPHPPLIRNLNLLSTDEKIELHWNDPEGYNRGNFQNPLPTISTYQYRYRVMGETTWVGGGEGWVDIPNSPTTSLTGTISGVDNTQTYQVQLRAALADGTFSSPEERTRNSFTVPPAILGFEASRVHRTLDLEWLAPLEYQNTTGYQYRYSDDDGATWTSNSRGGWRQINRSTFSTTRFSNNRVNETGELTVELRAINDGGYGPIARTKTNYFNPNPAKVATPPEICGQTHESALLRFPLPPLPPDHISQQVPREVAVQWREPAPMQEEDDSDGYLEFEAPENANWADQPTVTARLGPFGDWDLRAGLSPETDYQFRVRVRNLWNWGEWSDWSTTIQTREALTAVQLADPSLNLKQHTPDGVDVEITWTDPDDPTITGWEWRQSMDWGQSWGEWNLIAGSDATTTSHQINYTVRNYYTLEVRSVGGTETVQLVGGINLPGLAPGSPVGLWATTGRFPTIQMFDLDLFSATLERLEYQWSYDSRCGPRELGFWQGGNFNVTEVIYRCLYSDWVLLGPVTSFVFDPVLQPGQNWRTNLRVRAVTKTNTGEELVGDFAEIKVHPVRRQPTTPVGGSHHACEVRSGRVYCRGNNSEFQYGTDGRDSSEWQEVSVSQSNPRSVAVGNHHTCILFSEVRCRGNGTYGQFGTGREHYARSRNNLHVSLPHGLRPRQIDAGALHTCIVSEGTPTPSTTSTTSTTAPSPTPRQVFCWGLNNEGQVGAYLPGKDPAAVGVDGTTTAEDYYLNKVLPFPWEVPGMEDAEEVTAGDWHSCVRKRNGTVWCWGNNEFGQLGDGTTGHSAAPRQVMLAAGQPLTATAVSAGGNHTCAITDPVVDGGGVAENVVCWGASAQGQLGNTTTVLASSCGATATGCVYPVRVDDLNGVQQIAAGGQHSCARKQDGTVWCWGDNTQGQVGANTGVTHYIPSEVTLSGLTGVEDLTTGSYHSCAVLTGNNPGVCWGSFNPAGDFAPPTDLTQNGEQLEWTAPAVTGITGYQYRFSPIYEPNRDPNDGWVDLPESGVDTTSFRWLDLPSLDRDGVVELRAVTADAIGRGATLQLTAELVTALKPQAPTELQALVVTDELIQLQWYQPNHTGAEDNLVSAFIGPRRSQLLGYNLMINETDTLQISPHQIEQKEIAHRTDSYQITFFRAKIGPPEEVGFSLQPDTEYRFSLQIKVGDEHPSNPVRLSDITPPLSVRTTKSFDSVTATPLESLGEENVQASWTAPTETADRYQYRVQTPEEYNPEQTWLNLGGTDQTTSTLSLSLEGYGSRILELRALHGNQEIARWGEEFHISGSAPSTPENVTAGFHRLGVSTTVSQYYVWFKWQQENNGSELTEVEFRVLNGTSGELLSGWADLPPAERDIHRLIFDSFYIEGGGNYQTAYLWLEDLPPEDFTIVELRATNRFGTSPIGRGAFFHYPLTYSEELNNQHNCVVATEQVWCWGLNDLGQLGDTSSISRRQPEPVRTSDGTVLTGATWVDTGNRHSCGVFDQQVFCWGSNDAGQLGVSRKASTPYAIPTGLPQKAFRVATGGSFSCAWMVTLEVYCWGDLRSGAAGVIGLTQPTLPSTPTTTAPNTLPFVPGLPFGWTVPLDYNIARTVVLYRKINVANGIRPKHLTAGQHHACLISEAETVYCWGEGNSGQLGNGSNDNSTTPVRVTGLTDVIDLQAGANHTCAVKSDGTVHCWGDNTWHQVGQQTGRRHNTPQQVTGVSSAAGVGTGDQHSCAWTTTEDLYCWGANYRGQLGQTTLSQHSHTPLEITGISGISRVWGGTLHGCAQTDTAVQCWGADDNHQVGRSTADLEPILPTLLPGTTGATKVVSGKRHNCILTSDSEPEVHCWGEWENARLGFYRLDQPFPQPVETDPGFSLTSVTDVSTHADGDHTCALLDLGLVYCWGENRWVEVGYEINPDDLGEDEVGGTLSRFAVTPFHQWGVADVQDIATGANFSCAIESDETVTCWGQNEDWQINPSSNRALTPYPIDISKLPDFPQPLPFPESLARGSSIRGATQVEAGGYHVCSIGKQLNDPDSSIPDPDPGGYLYCWGRNQHGQAAPGNSNDKISRPLHDDIPTGSVSITNADDISLGNSHTCVLLDTNQIQCWGDNTEGQLGDGTNTKPTAPVTVVDGDGSVTALANVEEVAAGSDHTCARVTDGSVYCWGDNQDGQLGIALATTKSNYPRMVPGVSGAISISAGQAHTCAVVTNGAVMCWGDGTGYRAVYSPGLFSITTPFTFASADAHPRFLLPRRRFQATVVSGIPVDILLPQASGGDGPLTYTTDPALPTGLRLQGNRLVGMTSSFGENDTLEIDLVATDSDATGPDQATHRLRLTLERHPRFELSGQTPRLSSTNCPDEHLRFPKLVLRQNCNYVIGFPLSTGGDLPVRYSMAPPPLPVTPIAPPGSAPIIFLHPPSGMTFLPSFETIDDHVGALDTISGTPDTVTTEPLSYTWQAIDEDGRGDTARFDFTIVVEPDRSPTFATQTISDQKVVVGSATSFTLPTAVDGDGTISYQLLEGSSPVSETWLTRSQNQLTVNPNTELSPREWTWEAADEDGDKATLTFTVSTNRSPRTVSPIPDQLDLTLGTDRFLDLSSHFTDDDGDPLAYSATASPAGSGVATFSFCTGQTASSCTGSGSWVRLTPTAKGTMELLVTATDSDDASTPMANRFQVMVINRAPVLAQAAPSVGTLSVGTPDTIPNVPSLFTDPDSDALTITATAANLPADQAKNPKLSVSYDQNTGVLTLTPLRGGSSNVTLTATDGDLMVTREIPVTIANRAPALTDPNNSSVTVSDVVIGGNRTVSLASLVTDPDEDDLTYTATSNSNVSVTSQSDGVLLTGILATPSASPVTVPVTVTDSGGLSIMVSLSVTVSPSTILASATAFPSSVTITVGQSEVYDLPTYFQQGDTYSYSASAGSGFTAAIDPSTNRLTITGVQKGSYPVTVTVTDPVGQGMLTRIITVNVPNRSPQLVVGQSISDNDGLEVGGEVVWINLAGTFSDPDGDSLTFTAMAHPSGIVNATICSSQADSSCPGQGSWLRVTPSAAGQSTITVTATDNDPIPGSVTDTFAVTVRTSTIAEIAQSTFPSSLGMEIGDSQTITLSQHFAPPSPRVYQYSVQSSNSRVTAQVDSGGILSVAGVSAGDATVTLTVSDPVGLGTVTKQIAVTVRASTIVELTQTPFPSSLALEVGDRQMVTLAQYFAPPSPKVYQYSVQSSDSRVSVQVDSGGILTIAGVSAGDASVTLTVTDPVGLGTVTKQIMVTVNISTIVELTQNPFPSTLALEVGDSESITLSQYFSPPSPRVYQYMVQSSDSRVRVQVDSGGTLTIAGVSAGDATVTLTVTDPVGLGAVAKQISVRVTEVAPPGGGNQNPVNPIRPTTPTTPTTQPPSQPLPSGDGGDVIVIGDNNVVIVGDNNTVFTDSSESVHISNIVQLADMGVTRGCNPPDNTRFCPERAVTRAEMATFMVRAFDLDATDEDPFGDTAGNIHADNINRLAAAGISRGCNPPANSRFCPERAVIRAEMATFITRALGLTEESGEFTDTSGNVHGTNILRLASAGITRGCNPPRNTEFCPERAVTRAEMATFLVRSVTLNGG